MPSETYALEIGGPQRLELSRKPFKSEITVRLDGNVIGTIANDEELKKGRTFRLPDGSSITVQLVKTFFKSEVRVVRDGQPLLDAASDPVNRFEAAHACVFVAGGLSIIFGAFALIYQKDSTLYSLGLDLVTVISGVALLYLGYLVKQKSMVALALAVLIFLGSGIWALTVATQRSEPAGKSYIDIAGRTGNQARRPSSLPKWSLVIRLILLIGMIQGFGGIRTLKQFEGSETDSNS
jgi:hypothetical protein